jgi:hypothetical protein
MSATTRTAIPFESQSDPQAARDCGAACLRMVYRSFGKEIPRAEIWAAIAKKNRYGSIASTTHLMAKDALNRGFAALAFQARSPLTLLRLCHDSGTRAIPNHRLESDAPTGHYAVLVDIDDKNVVLHDPFYGPSRTLSHADFLELWQPRFPNSEILGYTLIVLAAQPSAVRPCDLCRTPMPTSVQCPNCKHTINLQPALVLGCINASCAARTWNYICCPSCDCLWTLSPQSPQATAQAGTPAAAMLPLPESRNALGPATDLDVDKLFAEVDRFCGHILGIPAAVNHPEVKKHLDLITAGKNKFKVAYAEALARRAALQGQLAATLKAAQEKQDKQRSKMEEVNRPSPPLDGDALGRALLKNLGFTE